MNKIFIITIAIITGSILSCSSDETPEPIIVELTDKCSKIDLNINQKSKFSDIYYEVSSSTIDQNNSRRWEWSIYNDTIDIVGSRYYNNSNRHTLHLYFKKNGDCVDFLCAMKVFFDDNVVFNAETGAVISGGITLQRIFNYKYKQQLFIKDEKLIGEIENQNTTFWIDFTPDNHRVIPLRY